MNVHDLAILGHGDALELGGAHFLDLEDGRPIFVLLGAGQTGGHEDLPFEEVGLLRILVKYADDVLIVHVR